MGIYIKHSGAWSEIAPAGSQYNYAVGGDDTFVVDNYNGTGEKWVVHRFTKSGNLTVLRAKTPARILVAAGGGNNSVGYGGAGGLHMDDAATIPEGVHAVVVGNVGAPGGDSSLGTISSTKGGGSGATVSDYNTASPGFPGGSGGGGGGSWRWITNPGGAGTPGQGNKGGDFIGSDNGGITGEGVPAGGGGAGAPGEQNRKGGAGLFSTITGASLEYSRGGGDNTTTVANRGFGGSSGVVIVAYRIG